MTNYALPVLSGDSGFRSYLLAIHKFPILGANEEYMLAKRWSERGDYDAAHRLVTSHLRLVAKIASGFKGYGMPIADLIAEGNIGLMKAVKKFDPERGFRVSTYAMWWIKAAIQEYVLRSWSLVKMGTGAAHKKLFFNLKRLKKRIMTADNGEYLYPEHIKEIASELDVSEKDVVDMDNRMIASDQRLNAPLSLGDDSGSTYLDFLPSTDENHEDIYVNNELYNNKKSLFAEAMTQLNEREQDIITKRRLSEPAVTLEELSQLYGVSRERIRQIENRAMGKLTEYVT